MRLIVDAGPLVAFLNQADQYHAWAVEVFRNYPPPYYSCPEVVAEAAALTGRPDVLVELIQEQHLLISFALQDHTSAVLQLLRRYHDQDMDLADACLVAMSEEWWECKVITVDVTDFRVYRRRGRHAIPLLTPERS